ncbi:MAG: hypothetical protein AAGF26_14440 [Cyanobacteria bacterium P01_G01_bin.49]
MQESKTIKEQIAGFHYTEKSKPRDSRQHDWHLKFIKKFGHLPDSNYKRKGINNLGLLRSP